MICIISTECKNNRSCVPGIRSEHFTGSIQYSLNIRRSSPPIKHTNHVYEQVDVKQGRVVLQVEKDIYELTAGESILIPAGVHQQWTRSSSVGDADCTLTFKDLHEEDLTDLWQEKNFAFAKKATCLFSYETNASATKKSFYLMLRAFFRAVFNCLHEYKWSLSQRRGCLKSNYKTQNI